MASDIPFEPGDLNYAEKARCMCGAGMAYVERLARDDHRMRSWFCSAILRGEVTVAKQADTCAKQADTCRAPLLEGRSVDENENEHRSYPFAFYEIRSEKQPGAGTTRPEGEPRKSYEEERAEAVARLPGVIAGIDSALQLGLKPIQCWGIAQRIECQPWPSEVSREIAVALRRALRHNPPPIAICTALWVVLRDSVDAVKKNACATCNEPVVSGQGRGSRHQGHRVWHSDCRAEEDKDRQP